MSRNFDDEEDELDIEITPRIPTITLINIGQISETSTTVNRDSQSKHPKAKRFRPRVDVAMFLVGLLFFAFGTFYAISNRLGWGSLGF